MAALWGACEGWCLEEVGFGQDWLLFGCCAFAFQAVSSVLEGGSERLGAYAVWVAEFLVQIPIFSCVPVLFSSVPSI